MSHKMDEGKPPIDTRLISRLEMFGIPDPERYSTLWDRFCANLIDAVVLIVLLLPLLFLWNDESALEVGFLLQHVIGELFPYAYFIFCHGRFGRTAGKRMMGIKVIDASEQKEIGFRQAILREAVPLAGVFVLFLIAWTVFRTPTYVDHRGLENASALISFGWFILELTTAALNPRRRALHDYIAGTVVVKA